MVKSRKIAFDTLNRCFSSGSWSALTLDSLIKADKDLSTQDAAFATFLTYGVIRNYRLLDYWIDNFCSKNLDMEVRNAIRMGAYQLKFCDNIPSSAAVNESVDIIKHSRYKSASGLVNAVLRKMSVANLSMPEDLAVAFSHPDWFVDRMISEKCTEFTRELLMADNTEAELSYHPGMTENEFYVQDEAAYKSVEMLGLKSGMRVLDCCAAPGGKSFTAAKLMNNCGEIISCDLHANKLNLISTNAKRLGFSIINVMQMDASKYYEEFNSSFDSIICDVPCSGFGVIRKKPEIRFKSESDIQGLSDIQRRILSNVSTYLKKNGRLLYSTCTIFEQENRDVADSVEGLRLIEDKTFYPNIDGTDGFYAAVLIKE